MIFLGLGFFSCAKNTPIDPPIVNQSVFQHEWSARIDAKQEVVGNELNQLYQNTFLHFGDLKQPATIFGQNVSTGERDWTYVYDGWDKSNIDYNYLHQNMLICVTEFRVFGFDLDSQKVVWEYDLFQSSQRRDSGTLTKGKFYLVVGAKSKESDGFEESILEFDPFTGEQTEMVKYSPGSLGTQTISPPTFWEDNIMIYNVRPNSEQPPELIQQYIVAFDHIQNVELWRTLVTDHFASNNLHPPIIYNDLVITGGDYSMYAFDLKSGKQVWKTQIPGYDKFGIWNNTNHLLVNDRLFVNDTGTNSLCLNPKTGEIIWHEDFYSSNCTENMLYYEKKDYLVFTSWGKGSVIVLDASTGELVHREKAFDGSIYNNDIVYDDKLDMFFTTTYKHAVAFKIN